MSAASRVFRIQELRRSNAATARPGKRYAGPDSAEWNEPPMTVAQLQRRATVRGAMQYLLNILDSEDLSAHDRRTCEETIEILKGIR